MDVIIVDGCIGCAMCTEICPTVFRMTDVGIAEVYTEPESIDADSIMKASESCPVDVIKVDDEHSPRH